MNVGLFVLISQLPSLCFIQYFRIFDFDGNLNIRKTVQCRIAIARLNRGKESSNFGTSY